MTRPASTNPQTRQVDVASYEHATRLWTMGLEITVLMAQFPSKEIAQLSYEYRTLGLGYANLGSLIMSYGYGYDSTEVRAICGAITSIMTGEAYEQSARMAPAMGPFTGYRDATCSDISNPVATDNATSPKHTPA